MILNLDLQRGLLLSGSVCSIRIGKNTYSGYYDQVQFSTPIPIPYFFVASEYLYVGRLASCRCTVGVLQISAI